MKAGGKLKSIQLWKTVIPQCNTEKCIHEVFETDSKLKIMVVPAHMTTITDGDAIPTNALREKLAYSFRDGR